MRWQQLVAMLTGRSEFEHGASVGAYHGHFSHGETVHGLLEPLAASRSLHPPHARVHRLVFQRHTKCSVSPSPNAPPIHHQKCDPRHRYAPTANRTVHLSTRNQIDCAFREKATRSSGVSASRTGISELDRSYFGRMLTLCLKKFSGSYFVLIALSRGRFGPYATAAGSRASSSR